MTPRHDLDGAALVTGGAKRIGAAFARHLARRGLRVVIHCRSGVEEAQRVAADIARDGGRAHVLAADLADPAAVAGLVARAREWAPDLRILVNNAASFAHDRPETLDRAAWDRQIAVNLTAPAFLARDFAAGLDGPGLIVNMLDCKLESRPDPAFLSYTVAKAGLACLTQLLAAALAPRIRVMGIAPGYTLPGGRQTRESFGRAWAEAPLGHGSAVEDLVRALDYAIDATAATGTVLTVDGGLHLTR